MAVLVKVKRYYNDDYGRERDDEFEVSITVFGLDEIIVNDILNDMDFEYIVGYDEWRITGDDGMEYVVEVEEIDESDTVLVGDEKTVLMMLEGLIKKLISEEWDE